MPEQIQNTSALYELWKAGLTSPDLVMKARQADDQRQREAAALRGIAALRNAGFQDEEWQSMSPDAIVGYGNGAYPQRLAGGTELLGPAATMAGITANYRIGRAGVAQDRSNAINSRQMDLAALGANPFNAMQYLESAGQLGARIPLAQRTLSTLRPVLADIPPNSGDQYIDDFLRDPQMPGAAKGGRFPIGPGVFVGIDGDPKWTAGENGKEWGRQDGNRFSITPQPGTSQKLDPGRQREIIAGALGGGPYMVAPRLQDTMISGPHRPAPSIDTMIPPYSDPTMQPAPMRLPMPIMGPTIDGGMGDKAPPMRTQPVDKPAEVPGAYPIFDRTFKHRRRPQGNRGRATAPGGIGGRIRGFAGGGDIYHPQTQKGKNPPINFAALSSAQFGRGIGNAPQTTSAAAAVASARDSGMFTPGSPNYNPGTLETPWTAWARTPEGGAYMAKRGIGPTPVPTQAAQEAQQAELANRIAGVTGRYDGTTSTPAATTPGTPAATTPTTTTPGGGASQNAQTLAKGLAPNIRNIANPSTPEIVALLSRGEIPGMNLWAAIWPYLNQSPSIKASVISLLKSTGFVGTDQDIEAAIEAGRAAGIN